eukprot:1136144-Pelagomonas_calceolata.AAC.1
MDSAIKVKLVAKECSRVIEGARDVGTVLRALHLLHQSFVIPLVGSLKGKELAEQLATSEADNADLQQLRLHCEILLADAAVQGNPTRASQCFFWDCFNPLSDVLLSIVAADWLPSFNSTERAVLFDSFFCLAPGPIALAGLHKSIVRSGLATEAPAKQLTAAWAVDGTKQYWFCGLSRRPSVKLTVLANADY